VRYSGFEQEVNYLYYQAATLFQAEKVYLHTDEPGVAPYFNGPYLEVVFCPTAAAVERVKRFVKRWEGRGESVS
jgi:hypothetical protein